MARQFIVVFALAVIITGCSIIFKLEPPVQEVQGNKVVCILLDESRFKTEVIKNLTPVLLRKRLSGYH